MLVLSRKEGERLVIGDNITLIVSRISGNRVTVGIEAPVDVKIYRGELCDQSDCRRSSLDVLGRSQSISIEIPDIAALGD